MLTHYSNVAVQKWNKDIAFETIKDHKLCKYNYLKSVKLSKLGLVSHNLIQCTLAYDT